MSEESEMRAEEMERWKKGGSRLCHERCCRQPSSSLRQLMAMGSKNPARGNRPHPAPLSSALASWVTGRDFQLGASVPLSVKRGFALRWGGLRDH